MIILIVSILILLVFYWLYKSKSDMEWLKSKGIVAYAKPPIGHHFIYADDDLNVSVFLPKSDGSLHVLKGTPVKCKKWYKYNKDGERVKERRISDAPEWKMNKNKIQYRGGFLKNHGKYLKADIHDVSEFRNYVDLAFIDNKSKDLLNKMNNEGELPTTAT